MAADPDRAFQWFSVAADAGNPLGLANLGVAYATGSGSPAVSLSGALRTWQRCVDMHADPLCAANVQPVADAKQLQQQRQQSARSSVGGGDRAAATPVIGDASSGGFHTHLFCEVLLVGLGWIRPTGRTEVYSSFSFKTSNILVLKRYNLTI